MLEWLILGKTALIYSVVTIYLGLRPRIIFDFANEKICAVFTILHRKAKVSTCDASRVNI